MAQLIGVMIIIPASDTISLVTKENRYENPDTALYHPGLEFGAGG